MHGAKRMMRKAFFVSLVFGLCATRVWASDFGIHAGYDGSDVKAIFLGADFMVPMGPAVIMPNLDYTKKNGIGYWFGSVDLDLKNPGGGPSWWFGAGPTYGYFTYSGYFASSSDHQWGWDLNGGVGWNTGTMKPYVTARYIKIKEFKTTGVAIGLRF